MSPAALLLVIAEGVIAAGALWYCWWLRGELDRLHGAHARPRAHSVPAREVGTSARRTPAGVETPPAAGGGADPVQSAPSRALLPGTTGELAALRGDAPPERPGVLRRPDGEIRIDELNRVTVEPGGDLAAERALARAAGLRARAAGTPTPLALLERVLDALRPPAEQVPLVTPS